jgi:type VI secretion system protein ImpL
MIDGASPVDNGGKTIATFRVGERQLQYQISTGSLRNPLSLPALREFRCPDGL